MDVNLPPEQVRASRSDWKQVAEIIGTAFANDPVAQYVFGTPRAILSSMRVLAREIYVPMGYSFLHGNKGATMWMPPGMETKYGLGAQIAMGIGMVRFATKGAMNRAMAMSEQIQAHHPTAPHMYLFTIGALPLARGQGVGKALLAPVLAACDRDGVPVYLENSNPANSGLYGAHGFEALATFRVGGDGPVMEPMWREPRTPG